MPPRASRLSAGWAVAAATALGLVALAASPPFVGAEAGAVVRHAFSAVCHQLPGRSPHVGGVALALCHRCGGVVVGLALGLALAPALGAGRLAGLARSAQGRWLAAAAVPAGLDWAVGALGLWANTPASRALTGAVFGLVAGAVLAANLLTASSRRPAPSLNPLALMPSKSQSILIGAAVAAVLSLVNVFLAVNGGQAGQYLSSLVCCLVAVAGAGGAVWHYTSTHRLTIPAGTGAGLGALAVVAGYAVAYVLGEILQAVGVFPSDAEVMERSRQQALDQGMDPAMVDQSMQFAEMFQGPVGAIISAVILGVLGAVVGAIAAAVFKKGEPDAV